MHGFRAVSAYNAADALAKFEKHRFDMVVTDFRMDGMNGLELARQLRSKYADLPIIIVTGYGPIDFGNDADACLEKDELFPALLDKIKFYIGEGSDKDNLDEEVDSPTEINTGT